MKIELGFAKTSKKFPMGILGNIINLLQKIDASHFYISYMSESGTKKAFDSTFWTVRERTFENFLHDYTITKTWVIDLPMERVDFIRWSEKYEGRKYGIIQIAGLLFMILRLACRNIFADGSKRLICNELGLMLLNELAGVPIAKSQDDYDLDDMHEMLIELEHKNLIKTGSL